MAEVKYTQNHGKTGRGTCPECGRTDVELYRVKVQVGGLPKEISACYNAKYNAWPRGHPRFEACQKWRGEHGLSTLTQTKEQVKAYKTKVKVVAAAKAGKTGPDWTHINDMEAVGKLEHMLASGQMSGAPFTCMWDRKPVPHPVMIQMTDKRRATFGYCGQPCYDAYMADLMARTRTSATPQAVLADPWQFGMMPLKTSDGRTKGMFVPGKGFKMLKTADGEEPVEFCKKCDRLADVCDCKGGPTL